MRRDGDKRMRQMKFCQAGRKRGRLRIRSCDVIKEDLEIVGVKAEEAAGGRGGRGVRWRLKIHCGDPCRE